MRDRKPVKHSFLGCCQRNFALLCFTLLVKLTLLSICCVLVALYTDGVLYAICYNIWQPKLLFCVHVAHTKSADGRIGA